LTLANVSILSQKFGTDILCQFSHFVPLANSDEDKYIMDNLLEKLRAGELATNTKKRTAKRRESIRERRLLRSDSVVIKAEDLLKYIQNEEENAAAAAPRQPRTRSRRLTASSRLRQLASPTGSPISDADVAEQSDEEKHS
jgi:hypothetical protein